MRFAISLKGLWGLFTSETLQERKGKLTLDDFRGEKSNSWLDDELATCTYMFPKQIKIKLPEIFNGLDDKVYNMINEIMEKKLKEEPIPEDFNIIESEAHKKMLYREAEEIALKELVYINHFENIDMEKVLKEN